MPAPTNVIVKPVTAAQRSVQLCSQVVKGLTELYDLSKQKDQGVLATNEIDNATLAERGSAGHVDTASMDAMLLQVQDIFDSRLTDIRKIAL
jgi:hypothetical protein